MLNDIIYYENRGANMDFIIVFFRDILSGPLYIALVVVNTILICSCIGYLGENYLNRKKSNAHYEETHAAVNSNTGVSVASTSNQGVQPVQQPSAIQQNNNSIQ